MELAGGLKIQELQNKLSEAWKPYMKDLDTMYTDATCYESEMRYPTDAKLLWECIEKSYGIMCEESKRAGIHSPKTKYLDVENANMGYVKQRKHSKSQEWHPDIVREERSSESGEEGERLCETGTCESESNGDGGLLRNAERAL